MAAELQPIHRFFASLRFAQNDIIRNVNPRHSTRRVGKFRFCPRCSSLNAIARLKPRVQRVAHPTRFAFTGSANLTGAGMGAKSEHKRNFESGIITDDKVLVGKIMEQFDGIWRGTYCPQCKRKKFCADYKHILA
jgi:hypothetical protein